MRHLKKITLLALILAAAAACSGRSVDVAKNDVAPVVVPPPPPPPHVRSLAHTGKLFGTMPVANRFQDPLVTFTGTGWFGYANNFQAYASVLRFSSPSPTNTPFLQIPADTNPSGATLIGQLKTKRAPLHVEVWLGRDGDTILDVDAELAGLFVDGEKSVPLTGDPSSLTTIDGRIWQKFTADVAEGPMGWAYLVTADTSSTPKTLYVGGPVAVDVDPNANADFVSSPKREMTVRERAMVDAVKERTRTLTPPKSQEPGALPGLPPPAP